jgi:hypothetical protein
MFRRNSLQIFTRLPWSDTIASAEILYFLHAPFFSATSPEPNFEHSPFSAATIKFLSAAVTDQSPLFSLTAKVQSLPEERQTWKEKCCLFHKVKKAC